jgi:itaconyl-CoA hydratase
MALKEGWRGRFFEDFEVGDVYRHPLGRTVTTTDNIWFTLLTQNTAPIHFDHHYASQTEFGKPLVDSTFTVALVTGQSVTDISQNVMANLGWDEVQLPAPVFEGDTIYSQSEVLEKRPSGSRPNVGIVTVKTTGYKGDGTVVITFKRTIMVYKQGHAPQPVYPPRRRTDDDHDDHRCNPPTGLVSSRPPVRGSPQRGRGPDGGALSGLGLVGLRGTERPAGRGIGTVRADDGPGWRPERDTGLASAVLSPLRRAGERSILARRRAGRRPQRIRLPPSRPGPRAETS